MKPTIRLALASFFFTFSVVSFADEQRNYDENECEPAGSAACVGSSYQRKLQDSETDINANYERVLSLLPKGYVEHLPTQERFQQLHNSRQAYVKSYCDNYWHFWNGSPPWKSAESINCRVELNRQYLNYLVTLEKCTKDKFSDACGQLMARCTPVSCFKQPTSAATR